VGKKFALPSEVQEQDDFGYHVIAIVCHLVGLSQYFVHELGSKRAQNKTKVQTGRKLGAKLGPSDKEKCTCNANL